MLGSGDRVVDKYDCIFLQSLHLVEMEQSLIIQQYHLVDSCESNIGGQRFKDKEPDSLREEYNREQRSSK